MKIISNNANLIHENRKEEAANTNLGIQMAKDLRAVEVFFSRLFFYAPYLNLEWQKKKHFIRKAAWYD